MKRKHANKEAILAALAERIQFHETELRELRVVVEKLEAISTDDVRSVTAATYFTGLPGAHDDE